MVSADHATRPPERLILLGATGSVGASVIDVIARNPGRFQVDAVVGGHRADALATVARSLGARLAVLADPSGYRALQTALSGSGIAAAAGPDAVVEAAERPAERVIAAIAGAIGLAPTLAAIRSGRVVAIANKEPLVMAGALMMAEARRAGARILPLDSEHNAVFQCLQGRDSTTVQRLTLTASGGPFREWPLERIRRATPDEALKHPNFSMGAKITVDSASLMNKGLELIEAHHLFALEPQRLDAVVHPEQAIHGMITLRDGTTVAVMGRPDMRLPVAHCLGFPETIASGLEAYDLPGRGTLSFSAPDRMRFPCFALAERALVAGGRAPVVLNAANEIAVAGFLDGAIPFGAIAELVEKCLDDRDLGDGPTIATIEDAIGVDHDARKITAERLRMMAGWARRA
jgi:1-deoxy-D-xylulose-5-phosphate reductoisomerase